MLTATFFFGYHRIIGLSISIICLALGTVFYFKVKHSSNYISSSIARVLLNMWFTAFILLVMNDTSNYIPFAYYYDVSFIYETTWQVILSIVVFLLTLSFTHHLTHIHAFLRINIFLILFGIASLPVTIVLVTNKIHSALLLDFSLLMSIIGFLSIALELRSVDRSHKLES